METAHRCLAVVPARGGSKGIPGKNLRLLQGIPLIGHTLAVASSCSLVDEIVVTSDDPDILTYAASTWGVRTRHRPSELAEDHVTLDPVVHDAVVAVEREIEGRFDTIITLQPTSPTLSAASLESAMQRFATSGVETCISVAEDNHLRWQLEKGEPLALHSERLNRQQLPKEYRETGAFVISRRECVTPDSRFGQSIILADLPRGEDIDIDDPFDWMMAEAVLRRLRVVIIVRGSKSVGLGHVYRGMTIADSLLGHDVSFLAYQSEAFAVELLNRRGFDASLATREEGLCDSIQRACPDIVLCDILDTTLELINGLKESGAYVVTFEDLGAGSQAANLTFNALYELSNPPSHHRFGAQYVCLSPVFHTAAPLGFREQGRTALISFGGTDECNLTIRCVGVVSRLLSEGRLTKAVVVLGPGYSHDEEFDTTLSKLPVAHSIEVHRSVKNMARLMNSADIALTSNGRTVYELAAMGVPSICIAQNDRETSHLFARYSQGLEYLGMGVALEDERIYGAMISILETSGRRKMMHDALLAENLRGGMRRVRGEILSEYWRWRNGSPTHRDR